ncbi:MazG-like family protein [Carboxydocella sp. JDF658]|uniref:MazG-like family protein n=1 Tax=Carboxydocella sp. JDF658 TaxID=1926600 RepID=UPI0009ABF1C8|nr:MazG-like family protein [Carboxydocella sp. JDF658]GAW31409.1 nucleotide pyrophosphohydrolase [Carboxydocella sp. JDF658]
MSQQVDFKEIRLPRLRGLDKVTLESTLIKLAEELGELAQYIGKFRGLNGENIEKQEAEVLDGLTSELLDVAQTAITMMYVLEDTYGVDIAAKVEQHIDKLQRKGYLHKK